MKDELPLLVFLAVIVAGGWYVWALSTKRLRVAISPRAAMTGYLIACLTGAMCCGAFVVWQSSVRVESGPRSWLDLTTSMAFSAGLFGMMWGAVVQGMWMIRWIRAALRASPLPPSPSKRDGARRDPTDDGEKHRREGGME
jgi:hypothetical protein